LSNPACASTKAPLQTEPKRRALGVSLRSHALTSRLVAALAACGVPATRSVWIGSSPMSSPMTASGMSRTPDELRIAPRLARDDAQPVGLGARLHVRLGEHVERAGDVQQLDAGHGEDRDGLRGAHGCFPCLFRRCNGRNSPPHVD
jgi:hypothetical protein